MVRFSSLFLCFSITLFCQLSFAQHELNIEYQKRLDPPYITNKNLNIRNDLMVDSFEFLELKQENVPFIREKNFIRAGSEWFLAQAFPATFNRFITKDPYSYISFKNFI